TRQGQVGASREQPDIGNQTLNTFIIATVRRVDRIGVEITAISVGHTRVPEALFLNTEGQVSEVTRHLRQILTDFIRNSTLRDHRVGEGVGCLTEEVQASADKRLAVNATVKFEAIDLGLINGTEDVGTGNRMREGF